MTTFTGTIPTIASGDTTTVPTNLATYRDALKAAAEAWSTWAPTYTGITAIGNAVVVARYSQVGKWVRGTFLLTVGSTTTFGAASLTVSLPVSAHDANAVLGAGLILDASPVARFTHVVFESGGTFSFLTSAGSIVTNAAPMTWAVSDQLRFSFEYEAA